MSARTSRKLGRVAIKTSEAGVMGTTGSESTMSGARKVGELTEGSGKTGMVSRAGASLFGLG